MPIRNDIAAMLIQRISDSFINRSHIEEYKLCRIPEVIILRSLSPFMLTLDCCDSLLNL
jgi:hypothetical protein